MGIRENRMLVALLFYIATCTADIDLSRWMAQYKDLLDHRTLTNLAIPGGHNSATYYLDRDKPFAQNAPEFAVELAKWAPRVVRDITYNFGRCQTKNVTEQLHEGIRYFDFRVMPDPTTLELYNAHGLYANPVRHEMEQIALYLQTNSDELIIVDIRNVYDLTRKLTKQLFSEFERSFASSLCRDLQCNKLHRLTLGQLTCNVIIMFDHEYGPDYACRNIKSPWIDKSGEFFKERFLL